MGRPKLTFRQREVLKRRAAGWSRAKIARLFDITIGRVRCLEQKAKQELEVHGPSEETA